MKREPRHPKTSRRERLEFANLARRYLDSLYPWWHSRGWEWVQAEPPPTPLPPRRRRVIRRTAYDMLLRNA